jgi:hypothetical protein
MPAFNPNLHEIDPATGFQVNRDTGGLSGVIAVSPAAPVLVDRDFPKWVGVHDSHIVRRGEGDNVHVSTPAFPDYHVNRADGAVTVLVRNEDEEKMAGADYKAPDRAEAERLEHIDPATRREVVAEFARAKEVQDAIEARKLADEQQKLIDEEALRRTKEKQELAARNLEASDKLAGDARERIGAALVGDGPAVATPYLSGGVERSGTQDPRYPQDVERPNGRPGVLSGAGILAGTPAPDAAQSSPSPISTAGTLSGAPRQGTNRPTAPAGYRYDGNGLLIKD